MIKIIAYLLPTLFDSVVPLSGAVVPVGRLPSTNISPFSFLVPPLWLGGSGLESVFAFGKKRQNPRVHAHVYIALKRLTTRTIKIVKFSG